MDAKPTLWRGLWFDSVLEADWAATFTVWGVDWEWHPFSIELSDGRAYEPDFLLSAAAEWAEDVLFEAKGDHDERIDKVQLCAADHPELLLLVGRAPFLRADYSNEYAAAVWHSADGSRYDWELNGRGEVYVSGEYASAKDPGLNFYKALEKSRHIR